MACMGGSLLSTVLVSCQSVHYATGVIDAKGLTISKSEFINSKKGVLFITGHSHAFEHFKLQDKDFLVIGGGGGLHQPLDISKKMLSDLSADYKPLFHYLSVRRSADQLQVTSHYLKNDFATFNTGHTFMITLPESY